MHVRTELPPPVLPPRDDDSGGGGGWCVLCTVGDLYEAQMIRGVLETNELAPVVVEPVQTVGSWLLPSGHERIPQRVLVLRTNLDRSRIALMEAGLDPVTDEDVELSGDPEWSAGIGATAIPDVPQYYRSPARIRWIRRMLLIAIGGSAIAYVVNLLQGRSVVP